MKRKKKKRRKPPFYLHDSPSPLLSLTRTTHFLLFFFFFFSSSHCQVGPIDQSLLPHALTGIATDRWPPKPQLLCARPSVLLCHRQVGLLYQDLRLSWAVLDTNDPCVFCRPNPSMPGLEDTSLGISRRLATPPPPIHLVPTPRRQAPP